MELTANFEKITPSKALEMLEKNSHNRPITDSNLSAIIAEINRKNFQTTGESIKISKNGNLLDGQHRLMAIVKTGAEIIMLVVRGLEEDTFKYMDTGRTRKASDVLGIEGIKNPTKIAAIIKFIINFNRGYYSSAAESSSKRRSLITNADVSEFNSKNKESLEESYHYGYNKYNRLIQKNLLASFHYIFKNIDAANADDFCHKLAKGENISTESPIYLLRQKMLSDIRSTRKMSSIEKIALICKAWNLYRGNKKVSILKWDSIKESFPRPV